MNEFKPCPFCGDTYIRVHMRETVPKGYVVGCNTVNCVVCHVRTRPFRTKQEAIEAWNRRVKQ